MSSVTKTGNVTHDTNCLNALTTLHSSLAGTTTQAAMNTLYVTYYKSCLSSAIANGCGADTFRSALRQLGVSA